MNLKSIREKIKKHNTSSKIQAEKYEQTNCWSYAYLTRWVVLEKSLKSLYDLYNRDRIRRGASEWIKYLDGNLKVVPDKIKDFSVQTQYIPPHRLITELLGTCNSIKTTMDSNGKFRRKRNRIAHNAEEFQSEKSYLDHRKGVDDAIKQLLTKLSQKINTKR